MAPPLHLWVTMLAVGVMNNCICVSGRASLSDSPDEAMQKFIDECNEMIDTMQHCEEGWLAFEEEIIESVNSFADRIVYTESLILSEAALIVDMADDIVATEEILIGLIEDCDCNVNESRGVVSLVVERDAVLSTEDLINGERAILASFNEEALAPAVGDTCSAMDMALEVMDACMAAFVTFNDDFLEVLSYMDAAIQDMGDRIVDTECLIVNMSTHILMMADQIVEVEQLTADMMTSCCRGTGSKSQRKIRQKSDEPSQLGQDNDDMLSHCENLNVSSRAIKTRKIYQTGHQGSDKFRIQLRDPDVTDTTAVVQHAKLMLSNASRTFMNVLRDNMGLLKKKSVVNVSDVTDDGYMPCDTWWNPFCCAAEVCAQIMVEMMDIMSQSMNAMTDICEACIDEMGILADDIVKTEENIVVMGYAIADMSECIVLFIEQGLDLMAEFCPSTVHPNHLRGSYPVIGYQNTQRMEGCSSLVNTLKGNLKPIMRTRPIPNILEYSAKLELATKQLKLNSIVNLKGNPFGDFEEMVETCMRMMETMSKMFVDQMTIMNTMFEDVTLFAAEEATLATMVVDMGEDVSTLSAEISAEEELMDEMARCIITE